MSAKVLNVMQQMLAHPEMVEETYRSGREVFFRYSGFVFSVLQTYERDENLGHYSFYVYPGCTIDLSSLARISETDPDQLENMVAYHAGDFRSEDERTIFRDLYTMLASKSAGVDRVFDVILSHK